MKKTWLAKLSGRAIWSWTNDLTFVSYWLMDDITVDLCPLCSRGRMVLSLPPHFPTYFWFFFLYFMFWVSGYNFFWEMNVPEKVWKLLNSLISHSLPFLKFHVSRVSYNLMSKHLNSFRPRVNSSLLKYCLLIRLYILKNIPGSKKCKWLYL